MPWDGMPRGFIPWNGGQPNARQITGVIKNCGGLRELTRILHEHSGALDHIHVSAAWVCLARIGAGRGAGDLRESLSKLQDRTWDVLKQMDGRGIANGMHSMAKLQKGKGGEGNGLLEAMQRRATATAREFNPQE
ncbi:hypothetical protein T484DRAFT_1873424, partial [Baffinella frigidus]